MATFWHRPGTAERCDTCGSFPHRTLPFRCVFDTLGPVERISCPLCFGDFSREHLLWNCTTMSEQREEFLSRGAEVWGKDLGPLAHLGFGSLSRFLLAIRPTFRMENVEGVSGC